jgi:hypothetical protein
MNDYGMNVSKSPTFEIISNVWIGGRLGSK